MFRVDFYEPELLHPASLDFVGSLPNLKHLMVTNPSVIGNLTNKYLSILSHHHHTLLGDDMFLELPELCSSPFPRVETIVYEGSITSQVKTPSYLILILSNSPHYTTDAILFLCRVETESSYVLVHVILSEYTLKESCCIISPKVSMSKLRNSIYPGSGISHRQLSPAQESGAALRQGGSGSVLLEVSAHRAKEKIGMFNFGLCRGDKRPQVCF